MSRHAVSLTPDEVHVWTAVLNRSPDEQAALAALLSPDEHERAARSHCLKTRTEFVISRGLLRTLLGAYLDVEPREIRFALGSAGKPELREPADSGLHFNITHSHGLALFAVTRRCPIGVDVEHLRPMSNFLGLAERYFSTNEVEILRSLPDGERTTAFFHAWTRKEAYLKAKGVGLSYGLERVEVTLDPREPARLIRLDGEEHPARRWSLHNLAPAPGFIGALAIEGDDFELVCRAWPNGD